MGDKSEHTFVMVKPDGVHRSLVGEIIQRFEQKGFKLAALKFRQQSEAFYKKQYDHLKALPFYPGLCKHMSKGPVVAMVWEGQGVVKAIRKMMGETDPASSNPGTIRGDYSINIASNVLHASDSLDVAKREVGMWFDASEVVDWTPACYTWIYE